MNLIKLIKNLLNPPKDDVYVPVENDYINNSGILNRLMKDAPIFPNIMYIEINRTIWATTKVTFFCNGKVYRRCYIEWGDVKEITPTMLKSRLEIKALLCQQRGVNGPHDVLISN
jgi:hypothetical protein